ncbi:MAG: potassium channel protein [Armatimonadetes bacterium]|nr:potassium channel protein [Armatimonadota bacterium]
MARSSRPNPSARHHSPLVTVPLITFLAVMLAACGFFVIGRLDGRHWSFFDCAYMTVITFTTVGYGEVLPGFDTADGARGYTIAVLVVGYLIILWGFSQIVAELVEGRLADLLGERRNMRAIEQMRSHYIVVGLGETGTHVVREMVQTRRDVVVVERDRARIDAGLQGLDVPFLVGDAEEDATLLAAGVKRAAGVVACLPEDKDNLYVVLSARQLNPELRIVARGVHEQSIPKMVKAGADVVVAPNQIGGLRIASEMIRPHVTGFLDLMLRAKDQVIRMEEVTVSSDSRLVGKQLEDSGIQQETNLLVLATRAAGAEEFVYNPRPDHRIEAGMALVVLGRAEDAQRLREMTT